MIVIRINYIKNRMQTNKQTPSALLSYQAISINIIFFGSMILRIATPPPYGYVVVTVYEARGVFGLVLRYKCGGML